MDTRTFFVADRVAISQVLYLLSAGFLSFLVEIANAAHIILFFWWLFCLIIPIGILVYIMIKTETLYVQRHWMTSFWLLFLLWNSVVVYLGVLLDTYVAGLYNGLWLSLFLSLIYMGGYLLAKLLRRLRHTYASRIWTFGLIIALGLIATTSIVGGFLFSAAKAAYGAGSLGFFEVFGCQACVTAIYLIMTGPGIDIAMGLHAYMLHCLYDPRGMDVEENVPNELYLKLLRNSMILTFISWLLLMVLFPPVAGGSKKRGKIRAPRTRVHRTYGVFGRRKRKKKRAPEEVEDEWAEHDL